MRLRVLPIPEWTDKQLATLAFSCPTCKAKKHERCRYTDPHWKTLGRWPNQRRVNLAGQLTKAPHQKRWDKLYKSEALRRMQEAREALRRTTTPEITAIRQFDRLEHDAMRAWLRENWRIFHVED